MKRAFSSVLSVLVLCAAARVEAQQSESGSISGIVTEATGNSPLAGAQIGIVGTQLRATSNASGRFTIAGVPVGSRVVNARMIGYGVMERTVTVSSGQVATASFELSRQAAVLSEVVTVGYATQTRANLTGAVDQIGSQALENRPISNLTQGLQGVLPNVNIRPR